LEIACADEEAYLNELVVYWLQFDGYTYDQLTSKPIEVPVITFQKFSLVKATIIITSFQNEHVVITTKEPKPIQGGVELTIISRTLFLPIELVEVPIVVINTRVEGLEKHVIPKHGPLIILEIGVGAKVL
jgi:hypothetical protein